MKNNYIILLYLLCAVGTINGQEIDYATLNIEEFTGDYASKVKPEPRAEKKGIEGLELEFKERIERKIKFHYKTKELKELFDYIKKYRITGYQNKIPFGIPVITRETTDTLLISSKYGYRLHPIMKKNCFHQGIDFSAKAGSYVIATANGKVTIANLKNKHHGKYIRIEHKFEFTSQYSHLKELLVHKGDYVKKGDTIGYVGATGRATGPHLHYEIHKNKMHINPSIFTTKNELF